MFRHTSDKMHPHLTDVPRKQVLINPLHLSQNDAQYLYLLFSELPALTIFEKDKPYLIDPFYEFTLTHKLIKRMANNGSSFEVEVVANELEGSELMDCYDIEGLIVTHGKICQFVSYPGIFCIEVKEQLDPAHMSYKQSQLLGMILMRAYKELGEKYFPAGLNTLELEVEHDIKLVVHFNLKHPIVARTRENNPDQVRFEVVGKGLGSGYFAEAFKVITTLVPYTDGSLHAKNSNRMLKMQIHEHEYVEPEYRKAALTPHLHAKRPVFTSRLQQKYSFLVSKFIDGYTLERFLESDAKKPALTIEDRINLSLAIIRALGQQVHMQGMIHRDISHGNIIADFAVREYPKASFIDMGLSKFTNVNDKGEACGTPKFLAPEVMNRLGTSAASDIYSLGVVLSDIWKVNLRPATVNAVTVRRRIAGLFTGGLKGLSKTERSVVVQAIQKMCSNERWERGSLLDAEAVFEQLAFSRRRNKLNLKNQQALQSVYDQARNLRREIHDYCLLNGPDWEINHVRLAIEQALLQFPDQPLLIREFITVLGIRALHQIISRDGVCKKMELMTSEYSRKREDLYDSISALSHVIESNNFKLADPLYQQYLQVILASSVRRASLIPTSVDDVVILMQKFSRAIERIQVELDRIKQAGVETLSCQAEPRPLSGTSLPTRLYGLFAPPARLVSSDPVPRKSPGLG